MDRIEKLFRRIPPSDRLRLQLAIEQLLKRSYLGLDRQRLKGYAHIYRVRVGHYHIMYYDDGRQIILKAVKRRDESTYSQF